jgi:hypothetical protein
VEVQRGKTLLLVLGRHLRRIVSNHVVHYGGKFASKQQQVPRTSIISRTSYLEVVVIVSNFQKDEENMYNRSHPQPVKSIGWRTEHLFAAWSNQQGLS